MTKVLSGTRRLIVVPMLYMAIAAAALFAGPRTWSTTASKPAAAELEAEEVTHAVKVPKKEKAEVPQ